MPIPFPHRRAAVALALVAVSGGPAGAAQEFSSTAVSCAGLKLQNAAGVPDGQKHKYAFGGSCRVYQSGGDDPDPQHSFPVKAEALWDGAANQLSETLVILGGFTYFGEEISGQLSSTYLCDTDPVVGKAACNGSQHSSSIDKLPQLSEPFFDHRPLTAGHATLAEATTLSQQQATASAPPPPPSPTGTAQPAVRDPKAVSTAALVPPSRPAAPVRRATRPAAAGTVTLRPPSRQVSDCTTIVRPRRPPSEGLTEIPLVSGARVSLRSGRTLAARVDGRGTRWSILAPDAAVLRLFPAGSRAFRRATGEILIDWGGGTYDAGPAATARLALPRR